MSVAPGETVAENLIDARLLRPEIARARAILVGRGKTGPFLENVIGALNPEYVIPIHYDNLFRLLTSPVRVTKLARLGEFLTAMEEDYPDVEIRQLDFDEVWKLPREM